MTGGLDETKGIEETFYSGKTNYVWNNLLRNTLQKIRKDELELIINLQDIFERENSSLLSEENIDFILLELGKFDIHRIRREEIRDVFDALSKYKDPED